MFFNEHDAFAARWLRALYPAAHVDARDVRELRADDLRGHARVHLFAGIGGWQHALELAGWPDDEEIWTGSLPCQPFSLAGRHDGVLDGRNLWPALRRLIAECRPAVVAGEQVASRAGRAWLAGVRHELEQLGYAVGAADLPACSVGAPHRRQRLFWVADRLGARLEERQESSARDQRAPAERGGDAGQALDVWQQDVEWLTCLDGPLRPTQPGLRPLAHGIPGRVGRLRGYGNAVVPPLAALFLIAYRDARGLART